MNKPVSSPPPVAASLTQPLAGQPPAPVAQPPGELGGQTGPEPTRYGDWEKNGRCTDF